MLCRGLTSTALRTQLPADVRASATVATHPRPPHIGVRSLRIALHCKLRAHESHVARRFTCLAAYLQLSYNLGQVAGSCAPACPGEYSSVLAGWPFKKWSGHSPDIKPPGDLCVPATLYIRRSEQSEHTVVILLQLCSGFLPQTTSCVRSSPVPPTCPWAVAITRLNQVSLQFVSGIAGNSAHVQPGEFQRILLM